MTRTRKTLKNEILKYEYEENPRSEFPVVKIPDPNLNNEENNEIWKDPNLACKPLFQQLNKETINYIKII